MIGLINLVVSAERELRDKDVGLSDESNFAMHDWVWWHRAAVFRDGRDAVGGADCRGYGRIMPNLIQVLAGARHGGHP